MSKIAWLDYDGVAREKSLQLLSAFQEKESLDELGLGTIRDAISDKMFPGTSTIMTRLRYMLFVPWLFKRLEEAGVVKDFLKRADEDERNLVRVLKAECGLKAGVIGARAGEFVKRLPSDIYWAGLKAWGIRQRDLTVDEYAECVGGWRLADKIRSRLLRRCIEEGEGLAAANDAQGMWCSSLPSPPVDFPRRATFELTLGEAMFLKECIIRNCGGSLLATLATGRYEVNVDYPWLLDFPEHREVLYHAKMFAVVMYGAMILYNILLTRHHNETIGGDVSRAWAVKHDEEWESWRQEVEKLDVRAWNPDPLFQMTPRVTDSTKAFVRDWVELVQDGVGGLRHSPSVEQKIRARERGLKKARSRFENRKALEQWGGRSGVRFDYRWNLVRRLLLDLYAGLEAR